MKPPFDIAADLDTPVSAYLKLQPLQPRFLLESVEGGERQARYSFIGFGGGEDLLLDGAGLQMGGKRQPRPNSREAVLDALRGALERAPQPRAEGGACPFAGGLVSVASYDLVRDFEGQSLPPLPPGAGPELMATAPRSLLVFDHLTRRAAVFHDGSEAERRSLRREVETALRSTTVRTRAGRPPSPVEASFTPGAFEAAVRRVQGEITAGEVYQLVLSIRFSGRCDVDPFQVYRALRLFNPSPYMYTCTFGERTVIGSSPEALVRLDGRRATLCPIAGTRPRGADEAEDRRLEEELLADPKEAAEHVMLVDLARNDLGRVAVPGTVRVDPSRIIERYSHVMHLVSGVEGVLLPDADAFDLFAAAFPAGTVVGAPKIRAMELIDELEPVPRGVYAGTVGYFGHQGKMDQAIAIRTLVLEGDTYTFQAGAGIVADSVPRREYEEVLAKSAVLRRAMEVAGGEM
ncbi:MAG: anthranilate synthase component I family protein [Acidobacteriota bacterium]|nr:anthranilate synthase component I family protein [Acidobacteriota bacterium]MDQ7087962.1 anthranilate synthase component I family protein [Acidobacteriota bacterium]